MDGIGKVAVAGYQHRHVVIVLPRVVQQVCGEHDVHALFNHLAVAYARCAEAGLHIWNQVERLQETLLLLELGGAALLVLDDVVVVRAEEWTLARDPLDECREIEISPSAGFLKGVIKIATVDEDGDALAALAPRAELISRGRALCIGGRRAPPRMRTGSSVCTTRPPVHGELVEPYHLNRFKNCA